MNATDYWADCGVVAGPDTPTSDHAAVLADTLTVTIQLDPAHRPEAVDTLDVDRRAKQATKARLDWVRANPGQWFRIARDIAPAVHHRLKALNPDLTIVTRNNRCDETTSHRRICDIYACVTGTVEGQVA